MTTGDLNVPFEEGPPGQTIPLDDEAVLAGGLVVLAGVLPIPGAGPKPALIFRFAEANGAYHHPLVLVVEPHELKGLVALVDQAAAAAIRAAAA
jgi:hypothetical protein